MKCNHSKLKITLGYVVVCFLLACNTNGNHKADPIKIFDDSRIDKSKVPVEETMDAGLHSDTILIKGMQFIPAEFHVKKGGTVVWVNRDIVVHDASEFPDKKWTSGPLAIGSSWKMKVNESYDYFCSIHITMKGKIVVDP